MNPSKDHKQIGQELELFFSHDYAPGAPFWLPKGMVVFKELEKYIRSLTEEAGYQEISTPIMIKSQLFIESGHFAKFGKTNIYNLQIADDENDKNPVDYSLKPMNCPEATIVYRFRPRSYKELPLRLSEIGRLHRKEKSGEVNGLLRVRQITMDDAHIFAAEDQIFDEVSKILDMMVEFYTKFGFEFDFRLATRPELFAGTEENWEKAEKDLEEALKKKKLKYSLKPADGAFYGPKIDVHIKDSLGREWQLATVQLDFHMPDAFDLSFIDNKGEKQRPVMIHRAILGSFERYIGILTEHYQGAFPIWLNPVQVAIIPITDKHSEYGKKIVSELEKNGIRAILDDRSERLQAKIRDASLQKIPYLGIIGDEEIEKETISVRARDGKDLGKMNIPELLQKVKKEIEEKV